MSTDDITGAGATAVRGRMSPVNKKWRNFQWQPKNMGQNQPQGPGRPPASARRCRRADTGGENGERRIAHTSEAADAFRRGEIMQNSEIDVLADSDDRLIALLSYATQIVIPVIMPIIVLLSESSKKRPFQRYHAVQSLAFVVFSGACSC